MEGRLSLILLCAVLPLARGQSGGSDECPCLSKTSPAFAGLPSAAVAKGLPSRYGQEGCTAYDKDQTATGVDCKTNAKSYCLKQWCYVDIELCVENKTRCEASGGTLGSHAHASCRARRAEKAAVINRDLWYSYETCGDLNTYMEQATSKLAGRTLQATMQDSEFLL